MPARKVIAHPYFSPVLIGLSITMGAYFWQGYITDKKEEKKILNSRIERLEKQHIVDSMNIKDLQDKYRQRRR